MTSPSGGPECEAEYGAGKTREGDGPGGHGRVQPRTGGGHQLDVAGRHAAHQIEGEETDGGEHGATGGERETARSGGKRLDEHTDERQGCDQAVWHAPRAPVMDGGDGQHRYQD